MLAIGVLYRAGPSGRDVGGAWPHMWECAEVCGGNAIIPNPKTNTAGP